MRSTVADTTIGYPTAGDAPLANGRANKREMAATPTLKPLKLSDALERWLTGDRERDLGSLIDAFGDNSFAILLVVLPQRYGAAAADRRRDSRVRDIGVLLEDSLVAAVAVVIGVAGVGLGTRWELQDSPGCARSSSGRPAREAAPPPPERGVLAILGGHGCPGCAAPSSGSRAS
jgi:hypothetical protein